MAVSKKVKSLTFAELCAINRPIDILGPNQSTTVKERIDGAPDENTFVHSRSGTIKFRDPDTIDKHKATVVPLGPNFIGDFKLGAVNQSSNKVGWTFTVSDGLLDSMQEGQTIIQKYKVTIKDGHGGKDTITVTVKIVGTNDVPEIIPQFEGEGEGYLDVYGYVQEDTNVDPATNDLTDSGSFQFDDVDLLDTHVATAISTPGNLGTLTPVITDVATGAGDGTITWTYAVDNSLVQYLDDGEFKTETFSIKIDDLHGGVVFQPVTVTIYGLNDPPVANDDTNWVKEDTTLSTTGNVLLDASHTGAPSGSFADAEDTDVDTNDVLSISNAGTFELLYGKLVIASDGSYTYTLYTLADVGKEAAVTAVQGLAPGDVPLTDLFDYTVTDTTASDAGTLTISIFGTDDLVTITDLVPESQGGDTSVDEDDLPNGSDPAPKDSLTQPGTFTISAPDGLDDLTVNGNSVILNGVFTPTSFSTALGNTLSFTAFNPATGVVTYEYTLAAAETHVSANGENALFENFTVVLTDTDTSSTTATLSIAIIDDVPDAINDDAGVIPEDAAFLYNVLGNDITGADTPVFVVAANLVIGNGSIVFDANGDIQFDPDPAFSGPVSISYTIRDADGDEDTATLTLFVDKDSVPRVAVADNVIVDEDGLPGAVADSGQTGETNANELAVNSGSVIVNFGNDVPTNLLASIALVDANALDGQLQTLAGADVEFGLESGKLVGRPAGGGNPVLTIEISSATAGPGASSVTYTYQVTLHEPVKHTDPASEDSDFLNGVTFQVTDLDNTTGQGTFNVEVVDDQPLAYANSNSVTEGGIVTGNVLTDGVPDLFGADGAAITTPAGGVIGVAAGSNTAIPVSTGTGTQISGSFGKLTLNADGSYTYDGDPNAVSPPGATDTFVYTIRDSDGDTSTVTLTINVTDSGLAAATDNDALVYESALDLSKDGADLVPGTIVGSNPVSTGETDATNTLVGNVTGGTGPYTYSLLGSAAGLYGTIQVNSDGTYVYTLTKPFDTTPDTNNGPQTEQDKESFVYQATDANGNTITGTIVVDIVDDIPTAYAEALQFVNEGQSVNGTFDYVTGADGATITSINNTSLVFGGDGFSQTIDVGDGMIKVKADGTYLFTADNPTKSPVPQLNGSFTVTDGDGDVATASFAFQILDANAPVGGSATARVDDDGLIGGNSASTTGDDNANSGDDPADTSEATFTGLLGGTVGADVPGTFSFVGLNGSTATVGTETVLLSWNAGTNTLLATINAGARSGTPLFDVQITNPATGTYKVTLLDNVLHSNSPANSENNYLLNLGYTITDNDGSTAPGTLTIDFDDDTPSFAGATQAQNVVIHDETGGIQNGAPGPDSDGNDVLYSSLPAPIQTLFSGLSPIVDDPHVSSDTGGAIGYAQSTGPMLGGVTANFGADGFGSQSYALVLNGGNGTASGLFTTEGQSIGLYQVNATLIVGRTGGSASGPVAFAIAIDPASGTAYTAQYLSLDHPTEGTSFDEFVAISSGKISASATITDGDGDSASITVDVSGNVRFEDSGPAAGAIVKSISEATAVNSNIMLLLDISGSMDTEDTGLENLSRLDVLKASVVELLEQYDGIGNVSVRIVTFSTNAQAVGTTWLSVADAKAEVLDLNAGGFTNYDETLTDAVAAFSSAGSIAGAQNVAYFISDGEPNQPAGSPGISASEQANWETFLNNNDVVSFALGAGSGATTTTLDPVAYNGVTGAQIPSVVVTDLSQLTATLVGTVAGATTTGNLLVDGLGSFGSDGGYVKSLVSGGKTFSYDRATDAITVSGAGTATHTFNSTSNVLSIVTALGGALAVDLDDGAYSYTGPASVSNTTADSFNYTLTDNDNDVASSTLTVNIFNADRPPLVRDDDVITNAGTSIVIPDFALLYNDTDPDGQAITLTAVSNAGSGTIADGAGFVTFSDTGSDGGTFTYTGSTTGLVASDTGDVTITRFSNGTDPLEGNGLANILINGNNSDTLNGYEGNDVLIGNGGNDTLNGGAGNDLLAGGAGADVLNGGVGEDIFYFASASESPNLATADTISDFNEGLANERIDLSAIFGGTLGFTAAANAGTVANSVTWNQSGGDTLVRADVTGDTTPDFVLRLTGLHTLTAADFIL